MVKHDWGKMSVFDSIDRSVSITMSRDIPLMTLNKTMFQCAKVKGDNQHNVQSTFDKSQNWDVQMISIWVACALSLAMCPFGLLELVFFSPS